MKRQEMFGNVEDAKRPKFSLGAIEQKGPVIIMSSRSKPDLVLNCKNGSYMVHISIVCQYSDLCSDIILNTLPDKFETHPLVDGKNPLRVIDFPETLVQEKDGMHACLDLMYNPESKMFLGSGRPSVRLYSEVDPKKGRSVGPTAMREGQEGVYPQEPSLYRDECEYCKKCWRNGEVCKQDPFYIRGPTTTRAAKGAPKRPLHMVSKYHMRHLQTVRIFVEPYLCLSG